MNSTSFKSGNPIADAILNDKAAIAALLERAGVPANARAEQLSLEDFAAIAEELTEGKA